MNKQIFEGSRDGDNGTKKISRMSFEKYSNKENGKWQTSKARIPCSLCIFSGFRLYSILFRFRISKFKKGWNARMAIWIQLDNVLSWVGRDISGNISSITTQPSWQILKSRRHSVLEVSFFSFAFHSLPTLHQMVFIWQMLFSVEPAIKVAPDGFFFIYFASSYVRVEFAFNNSQTSRKTFMPAERVSASNKFRLKRKHVCALLNRLQINKINLSSYFSLS